LFFNMQPYGRLLYAVIGATWAFHFTFSCWMIPKNQTDLTDQGTFFSLVIIYLMNLLLLSVMLILASPQITFQNFGADLLTNLGNFSNWLLNLFQDSCDKFAAVASRRSFAELQAGATLAQRSGYRLVITAKGSTENALASTRCLSRRWRSR